MWAFSSDVNGGGRGSRSGGVVASAAARRVAGGGATAWCGDAAGIPCGGSMASPCLGDGSADDSSGSQQRVNAVCVYMRSWHMGLVLARGNCVSDSEGLVSHIEAWGRGCPGAAER